MKEKIEKLLKSHLKRKLTITTATLIAFLLSSNLAMAAQEYRVGNGKIERNNSGTWENATNNLKKTGLFSFIRRGKENQSVVNIVNIVNRLKDRSDFTLLSEVNKPFINVGSIGDLTNNGKGKIENRGWIKNLNSSTKANEIENRGYIESFNSLGDIANKGRIYYVDNAKDIVNDGNINYLYKGKEIKSNITNNGYIFEIRRDPYRSKDEYINSIEKIVNNGIIDRVDNISDLKNSGKIENKGIIVDDLSNIPTGATDNIGRAIKNYKETNITDTSIDNKILNAYKGKIENNLEVKNNSILNMHEGRIAANKKISIDNSTVNMIKVGYDDGLELEFKNNSKIGYLNTDKRTTMKSLIIDNTTEVGEINAVGDIEAINLVPNEADRGRVLRINGFQTDPRSDVNTYISTNVDLLRYSYLGNITVEDKGRLTIAKDTLSSNGLHKEFIGGTWVSKYYKKDITIEKDGKIIIGIDPYNIGQTEKLGDGNNLTESVIGQVDTTDPNLRKAQSELNLLADSRLHGIVVLGARKLKYRKYENNSWIEYEADVRNEYKVVEELNLPIPEEPEPDNGGNTPDNGGSTPDNGGSTPDNGGSTPDNGGNTPDNGGNTPDNGGSTPDNGGNTPDNGANPPSGGTPNPPSGGTPNPPSGGTPNPPSGGTTNPPSGGTPNPPSGGTTNPPSGGTTNPPSGGTTNPPSGGTPNPPSGGTTNPPSGANPPSSVPPDYGKLNAGYEELQKAGKVKEYSVYSTEQLFGLYEYLRDMYANSPYALSGETSFRNLAMLRDNAYLDLKPNLNKWAVMGGLSHSDRENKFKHELGTTEADTITTGAYAKGEYGLKEDTTLGLILGGTNSKSDLLTGKVKGSSIYLGAYAKKYVNNFKFTLGTGIDLGEYKVDRNAIGYAGIIETEKYSAKQKNRAFELYAEARYSKDLGNNFYLEPNFNLAYSRVRQGSATENDGKINLDIKSKTFNQTTAALGLDLKKVLLNGNTSHSFALGTAYERVLSGAKENSLRASFVGGSGSGFDILVPAKEKGRTSIGAEYKLENKVGILFNLKMDYGFKHGSNKKDIRFSTGLGYKF